MKEFLYHKKIKKKPYDHFTEKEFYPHQMNFLSKRLWQIDNRRHIQSLRLQPQDALCLLLKQRGYSASHYRQWAERFEGWNWISPWCNGRFCVTPSRCFSCNAPLLSVAADFCEKNKHIRTGLRFGKIRCRLQNFYGWQRNQRCTFVFHIWRSGAGHCQEWY